MPNALTPDFYHYTWATPAQVGIDGRFVVVTWHDGQQLRAFDLWLFENGVGVGGIDTATREGLIDPAELNPDLRVRSTTVDVDGAVVVEFNTGKQASFHPGWLRHVADGQHLAHSWLPKQITWNADSLPGPPTHDATNVLRDSALLEAFVNDLLSYGIARFRRLSGDLDHVLQVVARLGVIRDTNFGAVWDVKAMIDHAGAANTNSTANTNLRLGPHTDLPSRETPPGFQFLHCLVNDTEGGRSTMADGAAVVDELRRHQPQHYQALTTLRWIFFNRGAGIDHRWSAPMIDLGVAGSPLTLRAFYPVRAFPDMNEDDIPRAYAAMSAFSKLADDSRFKMSYPFAAGDLVAFDNRRILHGRDAFSSGGARHLRGFYIDHDDILSFARVSNRARTTVTAHNGHSTHA